MIPLVRPTLPSLKKVAAKLEGVFASGMLTEAKYVQEFEKACAKKLGVKHVVATSNGTSALILALKCLFEEGEVILPSFTYSSGGHAALWCGLTPVFADINPETFNLDPASIEKKITKRTVAIMPTHVFGNPCEIEKIQAIAKKHRLKVIYDAAHAFGSTHKGKALAQFGDVSIYSLTPTKILTTFEGGLVATNNEKLARKVRLAKYNGDSFNRKEEFLGMTARMNEFSAIVGLESLSIFQNILKQRKKAEALYKKLLADVSGISFQKVLPGDFSVTRDMAVLVDKKLFGISRDQLVLELKKHDIQSKAYFAPPLHKKEVYKKVKSAGLNNTDFVSDHVLDLPFYSHMSVKEIRQVCQVIKEINQKHAKS